MIRRCGGIKRSREYYEIQALKSRIVELEEKVKKLESNSKSICFVHGECVVCKAERILGDPRETVSLRANSVLQLGSVDAGYTILTDNEGNI